ncbi:MAG: hypothetical protein HN531_02685 [Opitutae bacterium]|nr:hypothetical protein [Opitutae bacterium]
MEDPVKGVAERGITIEPALRDKLAQASDGDGRRVLNLLEIVIDLADSQTIQLNLGQFF